MTDAKVTQVADTEEAWRERQEAVADAMFAMDRDRAAAGLVQAQTHNILTDAYAAAFAGLYAAYQVVLGDANVVYVASMAPVINAHVAQSATRCE